MSHKRKPPLDDLLDEDTADVVDVLEELSEEASGEDR